MPASQLCRLCCGITAEALKSKNGYTHAARPEHLGNRGLNSCVLCEQLGHDYVPDYDPQGENDPDGNSGYSKWDLRLSVSRTNSRISNLKLTSEIWPGPDEEWTQELDSYFLLTPEGDPAAKHGIPTISRDLTNTRSTETFAFIKSCLDRCNREHDCTSILELESFANPENKLTNPRLVHPARLMYLGDADEFYIRLVQVSELECPAYMTLSHCWGLNVPKECLTTRANIEYRLKPFRVSILPPSFRDAIEIVRRLGIQFLWIDTLCIVQDSEEDWALESVKMGSIYQNSMLTIAASHAENSFGGCFNKQSISRDRASMASSRDTIEITGVDSRGAKTTLILFKEPFGDMPDILKKSPLDKRGWIFQERVLSPRTIHFTSTQVVWECRKEYWFEDRIPYRAAGAAARPISSILRPDLRDSSKPMRSLYINDAKAARIADHWYANLVADRYSVRAFTNAKDRLIALAGIASVYQQLTRDQYVAGLWSSSLAAGLSWSKRFWPVVKPSTGPRRPTWSWASQDFPLDFHSVYIEPQKVITDPNLRLLDTRLEYAPGHVNDFSPVIGGFITVTGCLVDLICELGSCSYPQDWQKGWEGSCSVDEEYKDVLPAQITALVIGRKTASGAEGDRFLLLKPKDGRDSAYTRMGLASIDYSPFRNRGTWEYSMDKVADIRDSWRPQVIHLY